MMRARPWQRIDVKPLAIVLLAGMFIALHYLTPTRFPLRHEVLNRLLYLPIIWAAVAYGAWGGILAALGTSLAFFPHILIDWGGLVMHNVGMVNEVLMYNVVGATTGLLVSAERRQRRRAEEASARLGALLREREEASARLLRMETELRQSERMALLGEMAAILAHEVRNPLGSIRGCAEILSDPRPTAEERGRFAGILVEETERLDQVLREFLGLARPTDGETREVDVVPILREIVDSFSTAAERARVALRVAAPPRGARVLGDPLALRQAFLNVLLNGLAAMPDGGEMAVEVEALSGEVVVTFTDTGVGIPAEEIPRLFDLFYTTRGSGIGLGLTITRRIVDRHRGRIEIASEVGKGTRVTMTFPTREKRDA